MRTNFYSMSDDAQNKKLLQWAVVVLPIALLAKFVLLALPIFLSLLVNNYIDYAARGLSYFAIVGLSFLGGVLFWASIGFLVYAVRPFVDANKRWALYVTMVILVLAVLVSLMPALAPFFFTFGGNDGSAY